MSHGVEYSGVMVSIDATFDSIYIPGQVHLQQLGLCAKPSV